MLLEQCPEQRRPGVRPRVLLARRSEELIPASFNNAQPNRIVRGGQIAILVHPEVQGAVKSPALPPEFPQPLRGDSL